MFPQNPSRLVQGDLWGDSIPLDPQRETARMHGLPTVSVLGAIGVGAENPELTIDDFLGEEGING